jgi:hypothetical protein
VVKNAKRPTKSRKSRKSGPPKKKQSPPTARDRKILERRHLTGNFPKAHEELLSIMLEIDSTTPQGPPLMFGATAARMALAKQAFEDAILSTDDINHWIVAARKAAQLPD